MARNRSHTRRAARSNPRGVLQVRRGGFGFVQTAEGEYFIPASKMNGAFDGDLVEVARTRDGRKDAESGPGTRKQVARIVRVVEHAHAEIVGRYEVAEPFGVVVPEDPLIPYDIFTQLNANPDIPDGSIVRVAITTYPSRKEAACGTVVEVLGNASDERVPIDLIVARHKLETRFSDPALAQAEEARVDVDGALASGYRDLRERFLFTIDPHDARDYDDAVSLERVAVDGVERWRVGVHIADVSNYVPWGSSIDLDARRRATSVYLVDRVIPMLPERLSNDVCSLVPGEPRRAFSVDMVMDDEGHIVDTDFFPSLIRSKARLSYDEALEIIEHGTCETQELSLVEMLAGPLRTLSDIACKRRALREAAGGLDFNTVEAKVVLDEACVPIDVAIRKRTLATELIEEAMIAANESVAQFLVGRGMPCLFRVHDKPSHENLAGLAYVFAEFPWFSKVDNDLFIAGNPHELGRVLELAAGRPEEALVSTLLLRSMKRAAYEPLVGDHYAMASRAYLHFTSPIRRYPDIVAHRMLKATLLGRGERYDQEVSNLPWLAEQSSSMERVADKASRESQEAKLVELLEGSVGETFSGMIAGVATYGLFVRLENTAEGLVEMRDLGREYFALDPMRHTLTGSDSGRVYRLGQRVTVRLIEADRRTRTLRFRIVSSRAGQRRRNARSW